MWLSMLVLVVSGFVIAGLATWLGAVWAERSGQQDVTLPPCAEIQLPPASQPRRRSDEAAARSGGPFVRDRLTFPPLDFPAVIMHSSITPGKCYRVDPGSMSCSCNYFLLRGAHAPVGSKERLCRHLRRFYAQRGGLAPIVNMVLLDDVHFCESDQLWSGEVEGVPVAIAWREGDPWVTLYSRNNSPGQPAQFERFNYHLGRQDWADGRMPRFNAAVIKSMLGEWFGGGKS